MYYHVSSSGSGYSIIAGARAAMIDSLLLLSIYMPLGYIQGSYDGSSKCLPKLDEKYPQFRNILAIWGEQSAPLPRVLAPWWFMYWQLYIIYFIVQGIQLIHILYSQGYMLIRFT